MVSVELLKNCVIIIGVKLLCRAFTVQSVSAMYCIQTNHSPYHIDTCLKL